MAQYIHNMPARYRASVLSVARVYLRRPLRKHARWVAAVNGAGAQSVSPAYQQAIVPFLAYNQAASPPLIPTDAAAISSPSRLARS